MQREFPSDNRSTDQRHAAEAVAKLREQPFAQEIRVAMPLMELTTFRIGGPAAALCPIQTPDDVLRFLDFADSYELAVACIGGGSNILANDAGFHGLVLQPKVSEILWGKGTVTTGAGISFDDLIAATLADGRPGLAFASGIPGSLGGAVVGNAGCYGHEISEFVSRAVVLQRDGGIVTLGHEDLGFAYRTSILKGSDSILLEVELRLDTADTTAAVAERADRLADRKQKHPVDIPCAGSYFQNLPPLNPGEHRRAAGALLDALGARHWRVGDAAIYEKHANIIVNKGQATCEDVLALARQMCREVQLHHGVTLKEEVRYLGPSGFQP
jgi:UDP-N-acetylmuramate dehydrogenase